jgi:hypothetical protein
MFKERIGLENLSFDQSKTISKEDKILVKEIFNSARIVHNSLNSLPKFHNSSNFAVSVTKKDSTFIKTEKIGEVKNEYVLRAYTHAYAERRNLEQNTPFDSQSRYNGTIRFGNLVLSVSGAGEMDTPIAIGLLVGAKKINYDQAGSLAREYQCQSKYMENAGAITEGFYNSNPTSEASLLPHQYT